MSQKAFHLMETSNKKELELQLAYQCAPLLTGIKISNLLIVDLQNKNAVKGIFDKTMISYCILFENKEKITFLLYRKEELQEYMSNHDVRMFMIQYGYSSQKLENILCRFSEKYRYYRICSGRFPHEMGMLLGYPVEDVTGFIYNEGKRFLYIGYWKVYSDLQKKMELFDRYNYAKEYLVQLVRQGISIRSAVEFYEKDHIQIAI